MKQLEEKLKEIVRSKLSPDELGEIIEYAMFPAGKLFRPKLALAMAHDAEKGSSPTEDHYLLAAAVEAHHAYSLVHDDLPCMDNDDERRGRPSTHKKYGEWKALLAGDAMITLSFELLAGMEHPRTKEIIGDFARMMGPQGLILGQFIDLSHKKKSLEQTLYMHELKTARLIQFALTASLKLSESNIQALEIEEFGKLIGVNFQILDDLGELTDEIDEHEDQVNAFLNYDPAKLLELTIRNNERIFSIIRERELNELGSMYRAFLDKTLIKIRSGMAQVSQRTGLKSDRFDSLFT